MKNYLIQCLSVSALAITLTACGEKDIPYIDPNLVVDDDLTITRAMADSVWNANMSSDFTDADEYVPSNEDEDYYEDFYDNWIDYWTEETRDVIITFNGDKATYSFEDGSKKTPKFIKITTDGAHVIIRNDSVEGGEIAGRGRMNYILQGNTTDGSVRIYSNKKFMITLDGVNLANQRGAAINIQKTLDKKRAFIQIADDTDNHLSDATVYSDTIEGEDDKGCIFSEGKLIFFGGEKGNGKLTVTGNHAHAIASDSRIHIHKGVEIVVDSAAKDGIHCDELVMGGGRVTVFAQKDGVQCDEEEKGHDGVLLKGGRLMVAAKRAMTSWQFLYDGGEFCEVGIETTSPTGGKLTTWQLDGYKGYSVVKSIGN